MAKTDTKINPANIQKAVLHAQGLTAEFAVLKAFNCDLRIVKSLKQLRHYAKDSKVFIAEYADEEDRKENFRGLAKDPSTFKKHQDIAEHLAVMKKLTNLLLIDIHYQLDEDLDKGLTVIKSERLINLRTEENIARFQECEYEEDIPAAEPSLLDDITISYDTLYAWFNKYSIEVNVWKTLTAFQTQPLDGIVPPKKTRKSDVKHISMLLFWGAIITDLFETKSRNFKHEDGTIKMDVFINDFIERYGYLKNLKKKSMLNNYIDAALDEFDADPK
jgi:hypothetical protein